MTLVAGVPVPAHAGDESMPPTLTVDSIWLPEGNGGTTVATFTLTRAGNSSAVASVKVRTTGGNAIPGDDDTTLPLTTLTFAPSETAKTVNVSVAGNTLPENDETFNLALSAPTGATIADNSGAATIANDDGHAYVGVTHVQLNEGNTGTTPVAFTITRSGNTTGTSSVTYKTQNASAVAGSDYTALPPTIATFAPGEAAKTVVVDVIGDTVDEANEAFKLVLSGAVGATIADDDGNCYVTDDEGDLAPGPTRFLAADSVTVAEGTGASTPVTFTVNRYGDLSVTTTVKARTSGGNATAGTDYTALPSTTLTFAPGETTKTLVVSVAGDDLPEANETFSLGLSGLVGAHGATIADSSGTATIVNDDGAAYVSVTNAWVAEGDSGTTPATFTLSRYGNTNGPSTVKAKTSGGNAAAGTDYVALGLTDVTFAPGETTKTVTVDVVGDTVDEPNEIFNLVLSSPSGATISDNSGTGTIVDDE